MSRLELARAGAGGAPAIGRVQALSWRAPYGGVIPAARRTVTCGAPLTALCYLREPEPTKEFPNAR